MSISLGQAIAHTQNWIIIDKKASWYRIIELCHVALVDISQCISLITHYNLAKLCFGSRHVFIVVGFISLRQNR